MIDPKQIERYSDAEKALIVKVFKDSPAIYALRNLFWQLELTEDEKKLLNFDAETLTLIKKVMLPEISGDIPLGQQADITSDPLLDELDKQNPAFALIKMDANDLRVQYLQQQFNKLINGFDKKDEIILKDLRKKLGVDQDAIRHVNMLAYKAICKFIDGKIYTFVHFSNPPVELTPEQQKEKNRKNSTK